ncbi:MAG TPA: hypothetical protein VFV38_48300 [Ktedonobacteraceae bacterium]|nr:hypothetical protein [Ktedonobacteraceae bacterium]
MPRMKVSSRYYTAAEVKETLGITQGQLNTYIRNGTLKPVTPPGKKQGVYLRTEVDQLAREMQVFVALRQKTSSTFCMASKDDLKSIIEITRVLFSLRESSEATLARRLSWMDRNPEIFYILKTEDQIVGYVAILPLKLEKIEKILRGEEYAQELRAEEIEVFTPGEPLHIYLMAAGVIPGVSHYEKRSYGARLISGMLNVIIDLGRRGIVIDTLAARSDTPDGIRLLKHGFTEIPTSTYARNFIIKVKESGIPFIQEYKQALEESRHE